jgi:hypothetical protein
MRKTTATAATLTTALTAALTLGLTLGTTGPASAASIRERDPQDTSHGSDLRAVRVHNGERNLVVVTRHTDLRRDPATGSAGAVYIDTDRRDRGPEFVFLGGFFDGTDYALVHTEGFGHRKWGARATGSYAMRIDYATDEVRMRMSRNALDQPGKVRIAVRVSGTRTDGSSAGLVDWLGAPHSFTPWVARG